MKRSLRSALVWLFKPLVYSFEVEGVQDDYVSILETKSGFEILSRNGSSQEFHFRLSRSLFAQTWIFGPVEGSLNIRAHTAYIKTWFIGHNNLTVVAFCASIVLTIPSASAKPFFGLYALIFTVLFRALSFHVSIVSALGPRLRRFFIPE